MKAEVQALNDFIDSIDLEALKEQGKTMDDCALTLDDANYKAVKSLLDKDGCYRGIKIWN